MKPLPCLEHRSSEYGRISDVTQIALATHMQRMHTESLAPLLATHWS
jgi:hypothetical protein